MNAGEFKHSIEVQRKVNTVDSYGSSIESWSTLYNLRAAIKRNNGNKSINNNEVFTSLVVVMTIYNRGVNETDRILYNGNKFKILFIDSDSVYQIITAEKIND